MTAVPAPVLVSSPPEKQAECVEARADALARTQASPEARVVEERMDLDGDGNPDEVVVIGSGREPPHFLYVLSGGCGRFVGQIEAARMGCRDTNHDGLCDLWVETWLMHGDRKRCEWHASHGLYPPYDPSQASVCQDVPGPRR